MQAYMAGAMDYIEGGAEIVIGFFICFLGGLLISTTIKVLIFAGITAGLFLGF